MYYQTKYRSPVGMITLACDGGGANLVGLWIEGQKYHGGTISEEMAEKTNMPVLDAAKKWLDRYFRGEKPNIAELQLAPIGGAVGHNPISIIIPCHRVVGSNGSLTGYAGGVEKKIKLLELEGADLSKLFVPKRGTAL